MLFSILILTLEKRKELFSKLIEHLEKQKIGFENDVEILTFSDNGENSIGLKRNYLVTKAKGQFLCFIDDDDWVSDTYIKQIIEIIKSRGDEIDCIGIKGQWFLNGTQGRQFMHSIKYEVYCQDNNYYYRPPNLLNPIKTDIIIRYPFPEINFGEDTDVAMRMSKDNVLKKEVFVEDILYYYYFKHK